MYIENVLDIWVQLVENGGKKKSVAFIILFSVYKISKKQKHLGKHLANNSVWLRNKNFLFYQETVKNLFYVKPWNPLWFQ